MNKRHLIIISLFCLSLTNKLSARNGISFSFQGMPQMHLVFEGDIYRIRPGIGLFYDKQKFESHLVIENDFFIRRPNKLKPFLGIGLKGAYINDHYYSYYNNHIFKFAIEPNFGLQYNFNDNFTVFGNVRLSCSYSRYGGAILSLGNTVIGLIFYK